MCSCGRRGNECPIWGSLLASHKELDFGSHKKLDLALLELVAARQAIMIDSSKTAWVDAILPFKLRRTLSKEIQLVHLVRHPCAVCWSIVRGEVRKSNHKMQSINVQRLYRISAIGWLVANLSCELFARLYPHQYHRVRYEDLANSPREVVDGLFQRVYPEGDRDFQEIGNQDNRHQLFGNRPHRVKSYSPGDIRIDEEWRQLMPAASRRLVEVLTLPLRGRYGYA